MPPTRKLCSLVFLTLISTTVTLGVPFIFRPHNNTGERLTPAAAAIKERPRPPQPGHALVDPCTNVYAYSCAPWLSRARKPPYEPTWNPWVATSYQIKHRLSRILTRHDPSLVKPQIFYRSCLRIVDHESKYLQELVSLVDGLGGWPLIHATRTASEHSWLHTLSEIASLGIYPVLKIHADLDYRNPTKVLIYIEAGNLIFPGFILTGKGYGAELEAYEKWILDTASHLYNVTVFDHGEVKEIVEFEVNLAKIMEVRARNERTTVGTLSKKFSVDWGKVLGKVFGGFFEIAPNTSIAVKNYPFLKKLFLLIERVGDRVVRNYLIWSVIKDLSRDTTSHMRDLNFLIDQAILGVKSDLTPEHECLDKIIQHFSPLLIPSYLKSYTSPKTFPKINSMFDSIKTEFVDVLMNSDWLSKEAKLLSCQKVKNIRLYLGYSAEIFDGNSQSHYEKLQMTGDHFANVIKLKKFKTTQILAQLSQKNPTTTWPSTPFDVNAYYSVLQNSIFIPLALLEPPFFHHNRDDVLNYGSLGFLIAHEMSHSLDPTGIRADPNGTIRKWWPDHDLQMYQKRLRCFTSDLTIGERIADTYGLKISFGALKKRQPNEKNKFFISYAQMWCEISEDSDIFANDEHSPNIQRVETLVSDRNFAETFGCELGSVCDLW